MDYPSVLTADDFTFRCKSGKMMSFNFSVSVLMWSFAVSLLPSVHAQIPGYDYIGQTVTKKIKATGEVVGSGELLKDPVFNPDLEVVKTTMRYAPDTMATRRSGQPYLVSRLMDFYYPTPKIALEYGNGTKVDHLPLMIVLHAGQGSKETSASYARYWASLGFTVIAPTVRSDRFGYDYCDCYRKSIYFALQDIRAAIRLYSMLYDYGQMPDSALAGVLTSAQRVLVRKIRASHTDGHSIFMVGKSYGGTIAYHAATRTIQTAFEDYLWSDQPYEITGSGGPMNMGRSGGIDAVGMPYTAGYPFPADRIKGFMCRTAAVFDSVGTIRYGESANPVPGLFIHNTCDRLVPYNSRELVHYEGLCDADITWPGGETDSTFKLIGSEAISQHMQEAGVYSELMTFCGGGHDSNLCSDELIDAETAGFVRRILSGSYTPGDRLELVYRYDPANYSDQCCTIGSEYGFMLKCSCDTSNPYSVVDLPYITSADCPLTPSCQLTSLCDLQPPGLLGDEGDAPWEERLLLRMNTGNEGVFFEVRSGKTGMYPFRITTADGREVATSTLHLEQGTNHLAIPTGLPRHTLLVGKVGNSLPLKFHFVD
ncbi:MAG: hypothetical protein KJZ58_06485 [Flavobacteriales bacterium]|nr:hypothetical protein [Flavobacteriales bacterium]